MLKSVKIEIKSVQSDCFNFSRRYFFLSNFVFFPNFFSNAYFFATWCRRLLIFYTKNAVITEGWNISRFWVSFHFAFLSFLFCNYLKTTVLNNSDYFCVSKISNLKCKDWKQFEMFASAKRGLYIYLKKLVLPLPYLKLSPQILGMFFMGLIRWKLLIVYDFFREVKFLGINYMKTPIFFPGIIFEKNITPDF